MHRAKADPTAENDDACPCIEKKAGLGSVWSLMRRRTVYCVYVFERIRHCRSTPESRRQLNSVYIRHKRTHHKLTRHTRSLTPH